MKRFAVILLIHILLISACGSAAQVASPPITETTEPTMSPAPTWTTEPTSTPTLFPTLIPTITPTLDPVRSTPPTIMLHRPSATFNSIAFLRELIVLLKQNNMKVVTYRDIYNHPEITATEKGHLFIITIDDIYLPYPMHADFLAMIKLLQEAGYPAVLGVVTDTDYADPQTSALLKELSDSGWEIATHTNKHANLGEMEKTAPRYVFTEVSTSMDKIETAIGVRPITLILPEGQMVNDARFIKRAKIVWCVGINGGVTYDSTKDFIYVGRESPAGTAEQTFQNMRTRFGF
jgi:peptidoglycan/xylan/chitin deacetylase (PgdA/CDA1 family)